MRKLLRLPKRKRILEINLLQGWYVVALHFVPKCSEKNRRECIYDVICMQYGWMEHKSGTRPNVQSTSFVNRVGETTSLAPFEPTV